MVITDGSTVVAKPSLDTIVVEKGQGSGGFPNPAGTDESHWNKVSSGMSYLLHQLAAPEEGSW